MSWIFFSDFMFDAVIAPFNFSKQIKSEKNLNWLKNYLNLFKLSCFCCVSIESYKWIISSVAVKKDWSQLFKKKLTSDHSTLNFWQSLLRSLVDRALTWSLLNSHNYSSVEKNMYKIGVILDPILGVFLFHEFFVSKNKIIN